MAHCTSAVHSLLEHWCEGGVITSHMNILADHFLHELIQRQTQKQKCSYTKFFIGEFRLLKKSQMLGRQIEFGRGSPLDQNMPIQAGCFN